MHRLLLSTSVLLALSAPVWAEVAVTGDARMGVLNDFTGDLEFSSRARVSFALSGDSDSGLSFGATFRADNAVAANEGLSGRVFITGSFGKLSMGDVDGAAGAAAGHVSPVGYTGLNEKNEIIYLANGGDLDFDGSSFSTYETSNPSALYEYAAGDWVFFASATNPSDGGDFRAARAYSIAARYVMGDYTFALGYELLDNDGNDFTGAPLPTMNQLVLGMTANLGDLTLKAIYTTGTGAVEIFDGADFPTVEYDFNQIALSADYAIDALTLSAFYTDSSEWAGDYDGFNGASTADNGSKTIGVGAAYDLGGGAQVKGGFVRDTSRDVEGYDLGVVFAF
jgi:outer membrane protein OmpU